MTFESLDVLEFPNGSEQLRNVPMRRSQFATPNFRAIAVGGVWGVGDRHVLPVALKKTRSALMLNIRDLFLRRRI